MQPVFSFVLPPKFGYSAVWAEPESGYVSRFTCRVVDNSGYSGESYGYLFAKVAGVVFHFESSRVEVIQSVKGWPREQ
jgi:hypothetical protein